MGETLFELLFKYRPLVYQRGELAFATPPGWAVALAVILLGAAVLSYVRARGRTVGRERAVLAGVRLLLLTTLLVLLARPVLLLSTVVPQENFLAVLVDDSRSMRIDDDGSRAGFAAETFLSGGSGLRSALERRFRVRTFRFAGDATRLEDGAQPAFDGGETRLGAALERVLDEMGSLPLTGVVVVSDGADQAPAELDAALLPLRAAGVPVFAVGVGSERFERDLEVAVVRAPTTALAGSAVLAEVELRHTGLRGRTVEVRVERDGRIVGRREVRLGEDGSTTVRLDFVAGDPGVARYRFRVPPGEGELVERNNERVRTVRVEGAVRKVLYLEGEPRHEVAFTRRAVAGDEALQLVVLQRVGQERYVRLNVDSAGELAGGFPRTRDELFSYHAIILGSVAASQFSHEQLAMLEAFVDERGGGLLMLGGRRALAEGGWSGTPVADALPVVLDPRLAADTGYIARRRVRATRDAGIHPVTRMQEGAPVTPWDALPALTRYNRTGPAKPGATTLLQGVDEEGGEDGPVLAVQRYGAGRAATLAVQDAWLWQMHADMTPDDETHERLWRQLLRWLAGEAPDRAVATAPAEPPAPGRAFPIGVRLRDPAFGPVSGARVTARVTAPDGTETTLPLDWRPERDGEYAGDYVAAGPGLHRVDVRAETADGVREIRTAVDVEPATAEYFAAGMRRPVLERVARATGGRYYGAAEADRLPEDLTYSSRGVTVIEERELWDMPAAFVAILVLLSAEWALRRRRGLA